MINALDSSYNLIGGAVGDTTQSPFIDRWLKSKRLSEIFRHTAPTDDIDTFRDDIIQACKNYRADAILASGTTITNYLSFIKNDFQASTNCTVLVEDYMKLKTVADKWNCYELCQKIGIPTPRSVLLTSESDLQTIVNHFQFPVIAKPRDSFASRGVHLFSSQDEFNKYASTQTNDKFLNSTYLVQEIVSGELHDVTSCSNSGRVMSMLTQQRLMTLYDFGGGGIINQTTDEPDLRTDAEKIIKYLNWNGILEFDFIVNERGHYLLECNPKIWGTTALTVAAGLNMPQQLIDLFVLKKNVEPMANYQVGLQYKWLFPECVYHWTTKPRTVAAVTRRIKNTFHRNGAHRVMHNIAWSDTLHLIGIVLNKSQFS